MQKYIHYCWFGDKPMPKLAKKCIKSWKKYLPDFEIKKWDETNVDLKENYFIKEAYKNKKWAFVSDYVRAKVLNEFGGIYFDTDMEVVKNIDELLKDNSFLGLEDSGYVGVGVWYESERNSELTQKLIKEYMSIKEMNFKNISEYSNYSIPKMISKILEKYNLKYSYDKIQKLENRTTIYPRDYFYPYSYDRSNNKFTDKTYMIHYYDASWIPLREKIQLIMLRKLGQKYTWKFINLFRRLKRLPSKMLKFMLYPFWKIYKYKKEKKEIITKEYLTRIENTIKNINENKAKYITIYNSHWLGVANSTKELFENLIDCGEILRKSDVKKIGDAILNGNKKQIIFSSFAKGWYDLATYLKTQNPKIKIKTFWHGSNSQILDSYGWERNKEIITLHKKAVVDLMGICKQSMLNFYKQNGFNSFFITNKTKLSKDKFKTKTKKQKNIKIGLYAARCDDWRKNMYTQILSASLIENAVIDIIPLNDDAKKFANSINLKYTGIEKTVSREELLERMKENDVNLYVTLSECSPMLSLESFEVGIPCVVGNHCHYFTNSPLEKEVVVFNEDDALEIKERILNCIKNKKQILEKYDDFEIKNTKESKKQVEEFLKR